MRLRRAQIQLRAVALAVESRLSAALEKDSLAPIIKGRVKSFDSWYAKRIRLLRKAEPRARGDTYYGYRSLKGSLPFLGDLTLAETSNKYFFKVMDVERKDPSVPFAKSATSPYISLSNCPKTCKRAREA